MKFKVEGVEEETTALPKDKILRLLDQQTITRRVEFARLCTDLHLGKIQRYDTPHPHFTPNPTILQSHNAGLCAHMFRYRRQYRSDTFTS